MGRRQGEDRVWKYGDFELSFNGELWCVKREKSNIHVVAGWDYAEEHIWPDTDTLYIIDFPVKITITSTGLAAEKHPDQMGDYKPDNSKTAQLRKVYKKTDGDYYIFYNRNGHWMVSGDITGTRGWLTRSSKDC